MLARLIATLRKHLRAVPVDALVVVASLFLAWTGRSFTTSLWDARPAMLFGLLAIGVYCTVNYAFGLYRRIWRYAAADEVLVIGGAAAGATLVLVTADLVWPGHRPVPVSVALFMGFFAFVGFVAVRYRSRVWTGRRWPPRLPQRGGGSPRTRVIIFGAGEAGQLLAWRFLNQREGREYKVIGFVDDDPAKIGMRVHGLPVLGDRHPIPELVDRHRVDMIVIAIYHLSGRAMRDILTICEHTPARVKVLPNVFDLIQRTDGLPPIRDVSLEDLLGRQVVEIDRDACRDLLAGKTVLVTGAAGSIGSELCRQIATYGPRQLLTLDNNETGLFELASELEFADVSPSLCRIIGDVTNRPKMEAVFEQHRPDVVFHAAAYKHVPLMEEHPDEAVRVNVLGTRTVADLACRYGAERFVFISTDKAVSPRSVMGATKRIGEMLVFSLASEGNTLRTGVRFGNVLRSRGSVVPTFEKQIEMGGPVTVTDPEMTRFFMSISEAVSLVIQAATLTKGGDLFVLDMGEQVRIEDLAVRLIRLRGLRPGEDIAIKYTGIRPGEKLHEVLTGDGDRTHLTSHPAISRLNGRCEIDRDALYAQIDELARLAAEQRNGQIRAKLWEIVGGYEAEA